MDAARRAGGHRGMKVKRAEWGKLKGLAEKESALRRYSKTWREGGFTDIRGKGIAKTGSHPGEAVASGKEQQGGLKI